MRKNGSQPARPRLLHGDLHSLANSFFFFLLFLLVSFVGTKIIKNESRVVESKRLIVVQPREIISLALLKKGINRNEDNRKKSDENEKKCDQTANTE